jgi:hypothetical protein
LEACGEFLERVEGFGVGAYLEGGDVADEGQQDRLSAPGAQTGSGPVGEGCG